MSSRLEILLSQTKNWGGDSDSHALTIFSIAVSIGAKRILELGVRDGNTTIPLLSAALENGGRLESVDKNRNYRGEVRDRLTQFFTSEELESWTSWVRDANEFLAMKAIQGDHCFDLVYIDDWHSYDHVKEEFIHLDKLVSPSSIILVHDTMYANYQPHYHTDIAVREGQWANGGPYRAVAELDQNFWEFATIPVNNGLTIVRKKYSKLYNV